MNEQTQGYKLIGKISKQLSDKNCRRRNKRKYENTLNHIPSTVIHDTLANDEPQTVQYNIQESYAPKLPVSFLLCFATQLHLHLFSVGCAAGPALQDTFPFQPFFFFNLTCPP